MIERMLYAGKAEVKRVGAVWDDRPLPLLQDTSAKTKGGGQRK